MEIILSNKDIESIIKKSFSGINSIEFPKETLKIKLDVDMTKFSQKAEQPQPIPKQRLAPTVAPKAPQTLEEKNQVAAKKGLMAAGGSARTLMRF